MAKKDNKKEEKVHLNDELENVKNQLRRTLADYQNLEKRVAAEKSEWIRQANSQLLKRLLPAMDTLMLAKKHLSDPGLDLSVQQMLDALNSEGVERIETIGAEFDPNLMEAIHVTPGEEGKVVDEIRAGYTLYGRVLRPAQVAVGKES